MFKTNLVLVKVVFDNGSKFKRYFTALLKECLITPICTFVKNLHSNAPVEHIHQGIYNIIVTKYIDRELYDYIDPWG